MQPKSRKRKQRAVVDTNVVVAGISGFRDQYIAGLIPSADLLHRWADEEHFVWLYSEDILAEYKEILKRLHVRSAAIGTLINFIREQGESVEIGFSAEISLFYSAKSIADSFRRYLHGDDLRLPASIWPRIGRAHS